MNTEELAYVMQFLYERKVPLNLVIAAAKGWYSIKREAERQK